MTAPLLSDDRARRDLEEVIEHGIPTKNPQHILPRRDLHPAARRDVCVVQDREPEPGVVDFRVRRDAADDEIVEGDVVAPVVGDVEEFGPGVEGRGEGGAGDDVFAVVGPVADVGAAGLGSDVAGGGVYGTFVEGFNGTFDAQVDYVSVKEWLAMDDEPVLIRMIIPGCR